MENAIPSNSSELQFVFSSFNQVPHFSIHCEERKPEILSSSIEAGFSKSAENKIIVRCETLADCDKFLSSLLGNPDLFVFRERVNSKTYPQYYTIIKEPMDFTTMQRRLRSGSISSISEFKRCLDLVWKNCCTFNPPGDPLHNLAVKCRDEIDRQWNEIKPPQEISLEKLKQVKEKLDKAEKIFTKIFNIPKRDPIDPPPRPKILLSQKDPEPKVRETVPTQVELFRIQSKLTTTPAEDMKAAWNILIPFLKNNQSEDRGSFNLKDLPDSIKIELKKAVLK
jgi:hypothetical protein